MTLTVGLAVTVVFAAHAQVIETTENRVPQADTTAAENEKLDPLCETAVSEYEAIRKKIDDRIEYLENVAVVGGLQNLKLELEELDGLPPACAEALGHAVDHMIENVLEEKLSDVDLEKIAVAQNEMEESLVPAYRELGETFSEVCVFCGRKPGRLRDDPLLCASTVLANDVVSRKASRKDCDEAIVRYDNARDALLYRRDLCRQSAKIKGMDDVLFWFQGREDLPLSCAVEIKSYREELRTHAEGRTSGSRYAFAAAQEKCGRALFPIYLRYGQALRRVCQTCSDADARLRKDLVSCY